MNVIAINDQSDHLSTEMDHDLHILEVEALRNSYAEKGDYANAQACFIKIKKIRESIQEKKKKNLEYNQVTEIDNLDNLLCQELETITTEWNTKIVDYEEKNQRLEEEMIERHNAEMKSLYSELDNKVNQKVKSSKEFLILEKQEQQLGKFQRFEEATVVKKKKDLQRQNDIIKCTKETNDKIKNQSIKKTTKHLNEKDALKRKFEIELKLLKKQRDDNIKRIEKKYQNKKIELIFQQKNERLASEKEYANKIGRTKKINHFHTMSMSDGAFHNRTNSNVIAQVFDENINKEIKEQKNEENTESDNRSKEFN